MLSNSYSSYARGKFAALAKFAVVGHDIVNLPDGRAGMEALKAEHGPYTGPDPFALAAAQEKQFAGRGLPTVAPRIAPVAPHEAPHSPYAPPPAAGAGPQALDPTYVRPGPQGAPPPSPAQDRTGALPAPQAPAVPQRGETRASPAPAQVQRSAALAQKPRLPSISAAPATRLR